MSEDWREHLEIVIDRSRNGGRFGHERYRELTADTHPDHEAWRRRITEMATGIVQPEPAQANENGRSDPTMITVGSHRPCCGGFNPYGD
jgi:hypothetical protein